MVGGVDGEGEEVRGGRGYRVRVDSCDAVNSVLRN